MKNWLKDTQYSARGGVSSAFAPEDLPAETLAWAKNVSVRGGRPRTRPALIERARLPRGKMQGIGYFSAGGGMLVCQVGGVLYRIKPSGAAFATQQIDAQFFNAPSLTTAWMQETDGSFIVQDAQSAAIIYDGASARRADPEKFEVPIGRQMAYGNGRLWVATSAGLVAGDIKQAEFQSELRFTETNYLLGGGAHYMPKKPTGLAFLPVTDTSSGLGSLLVFTNGNTESLRAEVATRDLWSQLPGFRTEVLPDIGACSHHAIVRINQDLYFRSSDGAIRSFRSARAEIGAPGNSPISREVSRLLDFESRDLLEDASALFFDDRLLMTASPRFGPRGQVVYGRLLSLDTSPLSSNQGKLPPVYDGEWSGVQFVRLVKGVFNGQERAFAVSCDHDGASRLWEITRNVREDNSFAGASPIKASVEYRGFSFEAPNRKKRLTLCRAYLSELAGCGTLEIFFRADHQAQWTKWDEREFSALVSEPQTPPGAHPLKNLRSQRRNGLATFTAPDGLDALSRHAVCVGYTFQIRLAWTGSAQIDRVELFALPLEDSPYSDREAPAEGAALETVANEIEYAIPLAGGESPAPEVPCYANQSGEFYQDDEKNPYRKQL